MKYPVIGLTGCRGAGKTMFSILLCKDSDRVEYKAAQVLFDYILKTEGLSHADLMKIKRMDVKVYRDIMKYLSKHVRENTLKQLGVNIELVINKGGSIVVSDVRTEKEAEIVKSYGGIIIEISNDIDEHTFEYMDSPLPFTVIDRRVHGQSNCQNVANKYNT